MSGERASSTLLALLFWLPAIAQIEPDPEKIAGIVGDRIATETKLTLVEANAAEPQDHIYRIDLGDEPPGAKPAAIFAAKTELRGPQNSAPPYLGLSHSAGELDVYLNGALFFTSRSSGPAHAVRLDYELIDFARSVALPVEPGKNQLSFRFQSAEPAPVVLFGFLRPDGMIDKTWEAGTTWENRPVPFLIGTAGNNRQWPEKWRPPVPATVRTLPEKLNFSDWRYYTGTFLAAMADASRHFPSLDYQAYIDRHIDFFLAHRQGILEEREKKGLRSGPFSLYYRFRMLDDCGPQGVPFLDRLARRQDRETGAVIATREYQLVAAIADLITFRIPRLPDGTLVRITPDRYTVQSDDLFMGGLFLIRAARVLDRPELLEDAVRQGLNFHNYLFNPENQLYYHAYFTWTEQNSCCHWGRGMGWMMMYYVELLDALPPDHPRRGRMLQNFRYACAGLLALQREDGRWHQILTDPATYPETSATAMFVRAFAEGYARGWLPQPQYRKAALKGWQGLCSQIAPSGIEGIVRGTPIFATAREYADHPARTNDPRGLGAILWAAVAVDKLK